jgi:hypothetical protein
LAYISAPPSNSICAVTVHARLHMMIVNLHPSDPHPSLCGVWGWLDAWCSTRQCNGKERVLPRRCACVLLVGMYCFVLVRSPPHTHTHTHTHTLTHAPVKHLATVTVAGKSRWPFRNDERCDGLGGPVGDGRSAERTRHPGRRHWEWCHDPNGAIDT